MTIINDKALSRCIRDAVSAELQEHFHQERNPPPDNERLLSKQELAIQLGVSLVTLTGWMKKACLFAPA